MAAIRKSIERQHDLFETLHVNSGVPVMTNQLRTLKVIAEACEGAAKPSGAGGGDCGIALFDSHENTLHAASRWTEAGIYPLRVQIPDPRGVVTHEEDPIQSRALT
jgi:phosphomevalonate kinase